MRIWWPDPYLLKAENPWMNPVLKKTQTVAVANNFDWQLNGVYSTKKGLSALFSRSTSKVPKDNYRKISTGADLDGWKLTEIHKDKAILKQGSQQKELTAPKTKIERFVQEIKSTQHAQHTQHTPQPEISPPTRRRRI